MPNSAIDALDAQKLRDMAALKSYMDADMWAQKSPQMPLIPKTSPFKEGAWTMPAETKGISELARDIAVQAQAKAYQDAVRDLIDAVVRFGACSCDVDHDDSCVWSKGMKEIKAWAQEALAAAQLLERLK